MKLGLVARADDTGLGNQTYEFYRHMKPYKTMVVDISHLNGNKNHFERYPDAQVVHGFPKSHNIDEFLEGLDVIFVAESPYNYYLYERARQLGIKIAVQYNYEFFDWYSHPHLPKPDLLIAPSTWHYDKVEDFCKKHWIKHVYLHCPVNREILPFKQKYEFKKFLHVAGKPASHDRNGTESVIKACQYIDSDAQIYIAVQSPQYLGEWIKMLDNYKHNVHFMDTSTLSDYTELYENMDVLVLPRRYGGNCLPLNEALSTGMPVIMPNIEPNKNWLPSNWLVNAEKMGEFKPRMVIDIFDVKAEELAKTIDKFASMSPKEVEHHTKLADHIAKRIDWTRMKPMYEMALEDLIR